MSVEAIANTIEKEMGCIGCREAVTMFWEDVNRFWQSNN